ncbi:hypothetical protein CH263_20180 [Rhodococcus sp. 06-1059B-a]|nr:hypothetical protein CH263_20180 [Rhodococcus sp. 06-1059B-a]
MTALDMWISTTTPDVAFGQDGPGEQWQKVGTVDTSQEADFGKHIQRVEGHRATAPRISGFYLSGDPESMWVQACEQDPRNQQPFWFAIDRWGSMRSAVHGARETYLVSNAQARVTRSLKRRQPEPHPGLRVRPRYIGIGVTSTNGGIFTPCRADDV